MQRVNTQEDTEHEKHKKVETEKNDNSESTEIKDDKSTDNDSNIDLQGLPDLLKFLSAKP